VIFAIIRGGRRISQEHDPEVGRSPLGSSAYNFLVTPGREGKVTQQSGSPGLHAEISSQRSAREGINRIVQIEIDSQIDQVSQAVVRVFARSEFHAPITGVRNTASNTR